MAEREVINNCVVEWQKDRGVLYVHSPLSATVLRISGLDKSQRGDLCRGMIDIGLQRFTMVSPDPDAAIASYPPSDSDPHAYSNTLIQCKQLNAQITQLLDNPEPGTSEWTLALQKKVIELNKLAGSV